jgi:hypothetical protein
MIEDRGLLTPIMAKPGTPASTWPPPDGFIAHWLWCSITGGSRDLHDATHCWTQLIQSQGVEPVGGNDDGRGATQVPGARRG